MPRRLVVRDEHERARRRPDVLVVVGSGGAGAEEQERRDALHEEPPRLRHGADDEVAADDRAGGLVHVPEERRVGSAKAVLATPMRLLAGARRPPRRGSRGRGSAQWRGEEEWCAQLLTRVAGRRMGGAGGRLLRGRGHHHRRHRPGWRGGGDLLLVRVRQKKNLVARYKRID